MYYLAVNNKDYFSSFVLISSGANWSSSTIQNNLLYFQNLPMKGYGEKGGKYDYNGKKCSGWTNWSPSSSMKKVFDGLGKSEYFTDLGQMCHSNVRSYVFNLDENNDGKSDIIEWMIAQ